MIFKQQLTDISTVLNNTGNTTKLLTSFNALDIAQQKVLLSSSLLSEKQKEQCITMATLSAANTKYTADQLAKSTGISTETLANWGLIESADVLTISELAERAASDAQAKAVLDKIIAQNAEDVVNGKIIASNAALATSEGGATLATGAFTAAIKANISAMLTWMITTPLGWLTMLVGGVFLAVKAYDALTVSVKEQKEKMEDSLSAYINAKSELSNITTDLKNQEQAMDDLLAKEKLTYAEQGQLEELQAITRELRIQKDLAEKEESRTQKEVAKDASDLFNKQFGKYDISEAAVSQYENQYKNDDRIAFLTSDPSDISAMIVAYKKVNESLNEAYGLGNQENIDNCKSSMDMIKDSIFETAQVLQEQQSNIADYYNTIKDIPYDNLTPEQKEIVDSYNSISSAIELIYQQLEPNTWKSMQFENVFSTQGIEKTKEELVEMVKAGTFDESTLQSYPKLSEALERNKVSASELRNELEALAEADDNAKGDIFISQTIDRLNTQLKPAFDSLKSAYQDIFTKDGFELNSINIISTCDSIKSKLDDMAKLGLEVDYSSYEDFVMVLSDSESTEESVKQAFNSLADSISRAGLSGIEDFQTLKAALEDLGIVNNEIIAFRSLTENTESLKAAGLDLTTATYEQINAFASEYVSAENLAQAINMLTQQKMLNVMENMDTSTEVANMISLAKKAGMTSDVIENLTELERIYQEVAKGTLSEHMLSKKLDRANELKQLIENEITKVDYTPDIDFSPVIDKAEESTSSTLKSFTDLLDKELNVLDKKMEAGYIDFNDYIQSRLALIEDYYRQGRLSADEYYSYLEKHYDKQLSYMDKAINAVTRRIDKEIDGLEKQKDEIKQNYQLQIDYLNEQKTLLEDANKERQRQINLQKALYELERAKNQRTMLIYSEDKGLHYVADDTAIKDAQQEVEDAEFDIQIADIESSISKLEEARDTETAAIDAMIEKLQDYKEQWNDITSAYEEEQEDLIAAQIFGQEWESEILDGRLDTLNRFKDDYIKIQQAMVDATYEAAKAMATGNNVTIGDSSKGKLGSKDHGATHGYEVVDENTASRVDDFTTKQEADAYAKKLNEQKAKENGMTLAQFTNSNIPGYYMKKYHTGLKQGLVDQHSFDEDFKLVQEVGLGDKEVPAILKEGEAVATPEQISNIADGIRSNSMGENANEVFVTPDGHILKPFPHDQPVMEMQRKFAESIEKMGGIEAFTSRAMIGYNQQMQIVKQLDNTSVVNNKNVQQPIVNNISVTLPNVTNNTSAEALMRDLQSLATKKFQVDWK